MAKKKKCPFCGVPIKTENLNRHIRKVHPKEKGGPKYSKRKRDETKRTKEREKRLARARRKKIIGGVAVLVLIIIAVSVLLFLLPEETPSPIPKAVVASSVRDFGMVWDATTLSHDFTINNIGTGVLEITKIETSCICTSATLFVGGEASGPFSAEPDTSPPGWSQQIAPGGSGTLHVVYDSLYFTLPQEGSIVRNITVYTNDPANPVLTLELRVNIIR